MTTVVAAKPADALLTRSIELTLWSPIDKVQAYRPNTILAAKIIASQMRRCQNGVSVSDLMPLSLLSADMLVVIMTDHLPGRNSSDGINTPRDLCYTNHELLDDDFGCVAWCKMVMKTECTPFGDCKAYAFTRINGACIKVSVVGVDGMWVGFKL